MTTMDACVYSKLAGEPPLRSKVNGCRRRDTTNQQYPVLEPDSHHCDSDQYGLDSRLVFAGLLPVKRKAWIFFLIRNKWIEP